jgi:isochorismate synthase EntC
MKLPNVQHLYTPISGRIAPGGDLLSLVEHLHPTPAVGGFPREAALAFIREREELDRGWYSGPVGWIDRRGEGEFAVAIRSALLRGNDAANKANKSADTSADARDEALLFVGCGIVADSDPASEYAESRLKMRPMLSALGGDL